MKELLGRRPDQPVPVSLAVRGAELKLRQRFPGPLWCAGELVDVRTAAGGRMFGRIAEGPARMDVHLAPALARLSTDVPVGSSVVVQGRLRIYPVRGAFQLDATSPLRLSGEGARAAARAALVRELEAEGVFTRTRRPLPRWPSAIGLVTSSRGAVRHDVTSVLARRAPWVRVVHIDCSVQGRQASPSMVAGLMHAASAGVDVVILARGGGATDDLDVFDDPEVVRSVAACAVPVVVAVGHGSDSTLADRAADVSAATPSVAAEVCVPDRAALLEAVEAMEERLTVAIRRRVGSEERRLSGEARAVGRRLDTTLRAADDALIGLDPARFVRLVQSRIGQQGRENDAYTLRAGRAPTRLLRAHQVSLDGLAPARLLQRLRPRLVAEAAGLKRLDSAVQGFSPMRTLERGYALVIGNGGQAIRRAEDVSPGARLSIVLSDGALTVTVDSVAPIFPLTNGDAA